MRARDGSARRQADLAPRDESRDHEAAQQQHPLGAQGSLRRQSKTAACRPVAVPDTGGNGRRQSSTFLSDLW